VAFASASGGGIGIAVRAATAVAQDVGGRLGTPFGFELAGPACHLHLDRVAEANHQSPRRQHRRQLVAVHRVDLGLGELVHRGDHANQGLVADDRVADNRVADNRVADHRVAD
jgi:hypothetical protein